MSFFQKDFSFTEKNFIEGKRKSTAKWRIRNAPKQKANQI